MWINKLVLTNVAVECIGKLQHIKELTTFFYKIETECLKTMFEQFDEKSQLQTLKFAYFCESLYKTYEDTMKEINKHLEKCMKPTWTLLQEKSTETWYLDANHAHAHLANNKWLSFHDIWF